jgi:peptidyl-tRNA hydrolase, PTH1 family
LKAVFGLGNPGLEYALSRHNVGFDVIDLYRKRHLPQTKGRLIDSALIYKSRELFLVKPMTYMNNSGAAIRATIDRLNISREDMLVIYDDLDIPLGKLKILRSGGPGSHKGMLSVILAMDSELIPRLRIGIGHGERPQAQVDYVLGKFTKREWKAIYSVLERSVEAVEAFRSQDIDALMTRFNRRLGL